MNFKKYHESKNLFDVSTIEKGRIDNGEVRYDSQTSSLTIEGGTVYFTTTATYRGVCSGFFEIPEGTGTITFNFIRNEALGVKFVFYDSTKTWLNQDYVPILSDIPPATANIPSGAKYVRFSFTGQITGGYSYTMSNIMLNLGSTALPYEPYSSEVWHDIPHYIHNTSTDTLTTLPADIYADGNNATVGLKGNMYQASGVSPTTPIQPQECGERTENLWRNLSDYSGNGVTIRSEIDGLYFSGTCTSSANVTVNAPLSAGAYTLKANANRIPIDDSNACVQIYWNTSNIPTVQNRLAVNGTAYFSVGSDIESVQYRIRLQSGVNYDGFILKPVLNIGGAEKPFEPYGYKIPISSANTTTPVYLGEVESTRKIAKYELTGQERWVKESITGAENRYHGNDILSDCGYNLIGVCSHYNYAVANNYGNLFIASNKTDIFILDADITSATDLKTYLQQQYAAGTPVCVWYVLATPTTGILNEPLRKIGDYADTVSGVTIPTTTGADSFDVLTTLKPSEVELTYTGWHDASAKEWDGSEWK